MPIEARPGQVRPFGLPNLQQFEPGGTATPGNRRGERQGKGQLGNPGNQTNPFVHRLILQSEIHEGEQLPGDEQAKIARINAVYHALSKLTSVAGTEEVRLQRGENVPSERIAWAESSEDIRHVDAALGLLTYRSLDAESIDMLTSNLRMFLYDGENFHDTGRFVLTPGQNDVVEQLTTFLSVPYDRHKTQYTFTVVDKFPKVEVFTKIEAPNIVEGKLG